MAAKWYLQDEPDLEAARALYRRFEHGTVLFAVPDCFSYELGGVVRTAERRRRITADQADAILAAIAELPLDTFTGQLLLPIAGTRARTLNITLYDALYLAVAELTGATLVTADQRLYRQLEHLPYVRLL